MKNKNLLTPLFLLLLFAACQKDDEPIPHYPLEQDKKDWGYFEKGSYWIYQNDSTLEVDTVRVDKTAIREYRRTKSIWSLRYGHKSKTISTHEQYMIKQNSPIIIRDIGFSSYFTSNKHNETEEDLYFKEQIFLRSYLQIPQSDGSAPRGGNYILLLFAWQDSILQHQYTNKKPLTESLFFFTPEYYIIDIEEEINIYTATHHDAFVLNGKEYHDVYHIRTYDTENKHGQNLSFYGLPNLIEDYDVCEFWIAKNVGIIKEVYYDYDEVLLSHSLLEHNVKQ